MYTKDNERCESPEYLRTSLAAAMTLGFTQGLFYRDARLYCINLLLTYAGGCRARCAYCGLSCARPGEYTKKSFIRVQWPIYPLEEIMDRIGKRQHRVKRICISMITRKQAVQDTKTICSLLRSSLDLPVSVLISPTVMRYGDLEELRSAGADKIGVAIDLVTPELFESFRGSGVGGPHAWHTYWGCLSECLHIFGSGNAGAHFMVGMGETEKDMCTAIQRVRDMGGRTHLFSFYPEANSLMADRSPPPMDQYRRIQIARYLIDNQVSHEDRFRYNDTGHIIGFGISVNELDQTIDSGEPFRTSGCVGYDGEVACTRPFGNAPPGPNIRNYPFRPTPGDLKRIRRQLFPKSKKGDGCRVGTLVKAAATETHDSRA